MYDPYARNPADDEVECPECAPDMHAGIEPIKIECQYCDGDGYVESPQRICDPCAGEGYVSVVCGLCKGHQTVNKDDAERWLRKQREW